MVRLLLDAGYLPHLQDPYGQYPLLLAVQHGHTVIAQMLIAARADVKVWGDNYCPIVYSIDKGEMDLSKSLIDARADHKVVPVGRRSGEQSSVLGPACGKGAVVVL